MTSDVYAIYVVPLIVWIFKLNVLKYQMCGIIQFNYLILETLILLM